MPDPARHLRPVPGVDPATGELSSDGPQSLAEALHLIAELEAEVKQKTTEARSWHRKFLAAKEDKEAEAQAHQLWGKAVALFWEWRVATGKMKSRWNADRFWLCQPYLEKDGFPTCRLAVWGIAAAPNRKPITPYYEEVYMDWELVFRGRAQFERFALRGWAMFGNEPPQPSFLDDEQISTS